MCTGSGGGSTSAFAAPLCFVGKPENSLCALMKGIEVTENLSGLTLARSGLRMLCALAGDPKHIARPRSEAAVFDETVRMLVILSSTWYAQSCQARITSAASCHFHLKRTIETFS